jgi:hypothetical protein
MDELKITKDDLREVIPKDCFERSNLISFAYLAFDIFLVTSGFYLAVFLNKQSFFIQLFLYPIWIIVQGSLMTSLWVYYFLIKGFGPRMWT